MPNEAAGVPETIVEFAPEFRRNVRRLAKKYRSIRTDLQPVLNQLGRGEAVGDQILASG